MPQNFPKKFVEFLVRLYSGVKYRLNRRRHASLRGQIASIEKKIILGLEKRPWFPRLGQLKHIGHFLSKRERRFLAFFSVLAVIAISGFFTLAYYDRTKEAPSFGGEYTEGVIGYPRFINPLYNQNNDADEDISFLVYSGLMSRNSRGVLVEDLAESYDVSDDEKTYTFILKKNARWHDGERVTADDVVFTINAVKNKDYKSQLKTAWENIVVEKADDFTVKFKLDKPFGNFPVLATVGILPKHIWEKVPVQNIGLAEANLKPVGSGPYKFKSFVKDKMGVIKSYNLEANEDYYGAKPNIEFISIKFYPDYVSAVSALENRQIDGLSFLSKEATDALKLKSRLGSYSVYLPQYTALFFNGNNNAVLKDANIRRAISMAIDKKKIISDVLKDDALQIDGPLPFGYPGYNEKIKKTVFSPEEAQKILVDAGWVLKDGGKIRTDKKGNALKIVLTTIDKEQNVKTANLIRDNLASVGIEAELRILAATDMMKEAVNNRNYEMLLFGQMYGPDMDPYQYWHSSAQRYPGYNLAMYSNRNVDILLEQALASSDKALKQKKYEDFQSLLVEDSPVIFLWQPHYSYLIDKKVRGVQVGALISASDRWTSILNSYINTKRAFK